jgi:hypothetical protein
VALPKPVWDGLVAEGYSFSRRGLPHEGIVRIACTSDTPPESVEALLQSAHRLAAATREGRQPAPAAR